MLYNQRYYINDKLLDEIEGYLSVRHNLSEVTLDEQYENLTKFLREHQLITYANAYLAKKFGNDINIKRKIINEYVSNLTYHRSLYEGFVEICHVFEQSDVNFVVFKGFALSDIYDKPEHRIMGDIDIYVSPEAFQRAVQCLSEVGYKSVGGDKHDLLIKGNIRLELHHMLLDYKILSIDENLDELLLSNLIIVHNKECTFNTLNNESHFAFLILHIMVHLKNAGVGLRQLLDLVLMSKHKRINYSVVRSIFTDIGLEHTYDCLISVIHILFDDTLSFDRAPIYSNQVIEQLKMTILNSGAFGFPDESNVINYMYRTYTDRRLNELSNSKVIRIIQMMLPMPKQLTKHYRYAKKRKWLLPFAWIHRFIRGIIRKDISYKKKLFFIYADKNGVNNYSELLEEIGL